MSITMVLLAEDQQHETFLWRLLKRIGFHPRSIRVRNNSAGGAGEQFVRQAFPQEVALLRSSQRRACLITAIDADTHEVRERKQHLLSGLKQPIGNETLIYVIPKRNIETWIHYLLGKNVDEIQAYPHFRKAEAQCEPGVKKLVSMEALPDDAPPSLKTFWPELARLRRLSKA